jgi:hypothetical protein
MERLRSQETPKYAEDSHHSVGSPPRHTVRIWTCALVVGGRRSVGVAVRRDTRNVAVGDRYFGIVLRYEAP